MVKNLMETLETLKKPMYGWKGRWQVSLGVVHYLCKINVKLMENVWLLYSAFVLGFEKQCKNRQQRALYELNQVIVLKMHIILNNKEFSAIDQEYPTRIRYQEEVRMKDKKAFSAANSGVSNQSFDIQERGYYGFKSNCR